MSKRPRRKPKREILLRQPLLDRRFKVSPLRKAQTYRLKAPMCWLWSNN
ncbi:hypothetical protein KOAAANKH_02052 [Brevundimonas sp. NIBR10]|nr:hypothetical protein KOAAANKH_02052 [Brevundimonas sp. NIBR10]